MGGKMENQEEIFDSPREWVADHIHDYVETDGRSGHIWKDVTTLLLTTRGRKSGKLRRTALIYGKDGDNYIIVASRGGHANHPAWYLNLVENPDVEVQVSSNKFPALARTATAEEKARLWQLMVSIWRAYDNYQAKTEREIPVVVLSPKG
jgi:deazaflavin-dependent oxidoreductase (nitroreductase family)